MRHHAEPVEVGAELEESGGRYRVVRVEPAPNPQAFGHVCAARLSIMREAAKMPAVGVDHPDVRPLTGLRSSFVS
jgi:hypothetical protein